MDKQKDYLVNDLINQKHFANITDVIEDPNHSWVVKNTINALPPKKRVSKDDRPLYKVISGIEKMELYDFFYKHFHTTMYPSTFFTTNNIDKVKTMFPGDFTIKSVNSYIERDVHEFVEVKNIVLQNRNLMNWVIIKKTNAPLTIENKKITLSYISLFVITEKSIKLFLYNNGLMFLENSRDIKVHPDDFTSMFGNTFYFDKILPKIKDSLRKGIGKFEKTIIRENGMRYKKNFLLYLPVEVLFEVDMNYKIYIQKLQKPKERIKEFTDSYTTDINNIIHEPDAPNGFNIIIHDDVYIPPAPEEKKVKKEKNMLGVEKKTEKVYVDKSYVNELKNDIKNTSNDFWEDMGDFKWVIFSVILIALFALFVVF